MYIKIGIKQYAEKLGNYINTNAWFRTPNRHIKQKQTTQIQLTCIKLPQKLTEKSETKHQQLNLIYIYKQYINLILVLATKTTWGTAPNKNLHPSPNV